MQPVRSFTQTNHPRIKALKIVLLANTLFSSMFALIFILESGKVASYLGWPSATLVAGLGLGLGGFALYVLLIALHPRWSHVRFVVLLDSLWVLGSLLLATLPVGSGRLGVTLVALTVALLAALQVWCLERAVLPRQLHRFGVQADIEAPVDTVWKVLADIGTVARWNPGVSASRLTSAPVGNGSSRRCDLGSNAFLEETVVVWQPREQLTMRVTDTNLPFTQADIHFRLDPTTAHSTTVTVTPEYRLKYGVYGELLNLVWVKKSYRQKMQALLHGLKKYAEAP